MTEKTYDASDEAVHKATGKSWDEWLKTLDQLGAKGMAHKDIVLLLKEKGLVESGWWQQTITVGYEKARGKRVLGQTADAGFQVGVSRTLPIAADQAWALITKPAGRKLWLGDVARLKLEKGVAYETRDSTTGEIRTVAEGKRIRLTWHPTALKKASTLQLTLTPKGGKTVLGVHQEKLSNATERKRMKEHWRQVLDALEARVGK